MAKNAKPSVVSAVDKALNKAALKKLDTTRIDKIVEGLIAKAEDGNLQAVGQLLDICRLGQANPGDDEAAK